MKPALKDTKNPFPPSLNYSSISALSNYSSFRALPSPHGNNSTSFSVCGDARHFHGRGHSRGGHFANFQC